MAEKNYSGFDHPGTMSAFVSNVEYYVVVGHDVDTGQFWGQVRTGGSVVYNTDSYDLAESAWAESLGYLSGLGEVEL